MFDFLCMANNYGGRKINNDTVGKAEIDTAMVTDSEQSYETGISHPRYNDGNWIIVEMYDTIEESKAGHEKWCNKFRDGLLPSSLKDIGSSTIAKLCDSKESLNYLREPHKLQITKQEELNVKN